MVKTEVLIDEPIDENQMLPDELEILRRLHILYQEKDGHNAKVVELRARISQDGQDIGHLLAEANRFQDAARRRAAMSQKDRLLEATELESLHEKQRMIEDFEHKLATLRTHT